MITAIAKVELKYFYYENHLVGVLCQINPYRLFNAKSCLYIYDLFENSLLGILFLNELLELIRLHTIKWFQVLLF